MRTETLFCVLFEPHSGSTPVLHRDTFLLSLDVWYTFQLFSTTDSSCAARILMPGKAVEPAQDHGECATNANSQSSTLSVSVVNETPTWALETDPRPLNNLHRLLVRHASMLL